MLTEAEISLGHALFDAFTASDKPVMPEGRRDEVVALLTKLMSHVTPLTDYTDWLERERVRRGLKVKMLTRGGFDIPDQLIYANGFGELSDEVLADIALSPEALDALDEFIIEGDHDTDPGQWLFPGTVSGQ